MAASGRFTKKGIADRLYSLGLRTRKGNRLSAQTLGPLLRHPIYMGMVPDRKTGKLYQGDFEPLVDADTFYRAQEGTPSKRASTPHKRNHPDFPLKIFVRCGYCGNPLTGSKPKGRTRRYAYYSCRSKKRDCSSRFDIRKEDLEQSFLELLESLKPDQEYMALFREIILDCWSNRESEVTALRSQLQRHIDELLLREERLVKAHLDEDRIPKETFHRLMDKLREDLTLARLELHEATLDDLDIEGILSFVEQSLLDAPTLWREFGPNQRQRFQWILFPDGLSFDGKRFGTAVTSPIFSYLQDVQPEKEDMVARTGFEPVLPA